MAVVVVEELDLSGGETKDGKAQRCSEEEDERKDKKRKGARRRARWEFCRVFLSLSQKVRCKSATNFFFDNVLRKCELM